MMRYFIENHSVLTFETENQIRPLMTKITIPPPTSAQNPGISPAKMATQIGLRIGSSKSRMMQLMAESAEVCITVTHLDGLVLARSVFHHSMNYRSAVMYGKGELITDPDEKMKALEIFTEKLIPGRWDDARQPTPIESKATTIVRVPIDLASAKIRTGPPGDDDEDYELDIWAGVLPMRTVFGELEADPLLKEGVDTPAYLTDYANSKQ